MIAVPVNVREPNQNRYQEPIREDEVALCSLSYPLQLEQAAGEGSCSRSALQVQVRGIETCNSHKFIPGFDH